jgi:hypothetical protein
MQVFIVRPFGIKKVLKEEPGEPPVEIDFEKVQSELIAPALEAVKIEGGTTGKIFEAGDIREDMFSLLLQAEIVIADITIHNANVFYELGIRHALRDKMTILIKSQGVSETPFDILGYRYVTYDRHKPSAAIALLIQTIRETLLANRVDSPVFNMLPGLRAQEYEKFIAVPEGFADEVRIAAAAGQAGKLSLLAHEAEGFNWVIPGLRLAGEALFRLKAFDAARSVWEEVRDAAPNDQQANERLATVYQRIAEREMARNRSFGMELLTKSDIALENLLHDPNALSKDHRAEIFALKGRNLKSKWLINWRQYPEERRGVHALQSDLLDEALQSYERGYYHNLNHYYAGINALSMMTMKLALIEKYPAEWLNKFSRQKDADREKDDIVEKRQLLATSVNLTIEAEETLLREKNKPDLWLDITRADFVFLTETSAGRITAQYTSALEGAPSFSYESVQRQLSVFRELGIMNENVAAAMGAIHVPTVGGQTIDYYLLFTGHMIDQPGRMNPRFPPSKEDAVRKKIKEFIQTEIKDNTKKFIGIAGGACGGDILFHEVCAELAIQTELYLALPREDFIRSSVAFAGPGWVDRFNQLFLRLPRHVLCDSPDLPKWLSKKEDYTIWVRNNLWELNSALLNGGMNVTLIALWDLKGGDGPGGTEHMIKIAKERGAKTAIININSLG